jgi:hypothetical protein
MNMQKAGKEMMAHGLCVAEFAKFLEEARTTHLNTMRFVLEDFNEGAKKDPASNWRLEPRAMSALTLSIAKDATKRYFEELPAGEFEEAESLGWLLARLVRKLYRVGASGDIKHLVRLFESTEYPLDQAVYSDKGAERSVIDVMREIVAEADKIEPAESLKNLHKTLSDEEPLRKNDDLAEALRKTKEANSDHSRITMELSVWYAGGSEGEVTLTEAELLALHAELRRMRGKEQELLPKDEQQAEPKSAVDVLENLYVQLKARAKDAPRFTLQLWDSEEGVSDHGIDVSENDFHAILALLRASGEAASTKPASEGVGEMRPDPEALEACRVAFEKVVETTRLR